jgi:hypothetical protein
MSGSIPEMPTDYSRILPYVIALLAVFLVYRRLRRSFGRQLLSPRRMYWRIGILALLGCSLLPAVRGSLPFAAAELLGATLGVALGAWGAHLTRFQRHEGRLYYVPHTYIGIAVSLLFVGRLAYRFVAIYSLSHGASMAQGAATQSAHVPGSGPPAMMASPFTAASLFLVVGYYVFYYSAVLWKAKRISPEDLEDTGPSMPPSKGEGAASG